MKGNLEGGALRLSMRLADGDKLGGALGNTMGKV